MIEYLNEASLTSTRDDSCCRTSRCFSRLVGRLVGRQWQADQFF